MAVPKQYGLYAKESLYYNTKQELTPIQKKLIEQMQKQRMEVFTSYNQYKEAVASRDENGIKPDSYFPGREGWMVARNRVINGNRVSFISKAKDCPLITAVPVSIDMEITNKIPVALLKEILANFNKVNADSGNECAAQIYRERTGERKYFIYYPEQKVSSAQVTYAHDPKLMDLAKEFDLIMELHSHDSMGAFWSGTDDSNENTTGFYMVIGRFNNPVVEYRCRVKMGDTYENFECSKIFDFGDESEQDVLTRANFITPNNLLDEKITKESYTYHYLGSSYATGYPAYDYGYGYSAYSNYYYSAKNASAKTAALTEQKRLMKLLKGAPEVIDINSPLYDKLWDAAVYNKTTRLWESCGYQEDMMSPTGCWVLKKSKNQDVQGEEVESEDATAATDYVKRIAEGYSAKGFDEQEKRPTPANGYDSAHYLMGDVDEKDARYGVLPGKIQQYSNFDLDLQNGEMMEDADYNDRLSMAVASRQEAQSNIEKFLKDGMGGVREETNSKFIANVMNTAFLRTPAASINLGVFWELLTPVEKQRLAKAFHLTVLDLAALMAGAYSVTVSSNVSEFLYKCILGDAKYVEAKLGLIATQVMGENPTSATQFIAIIQELLDLKEETK